MSKRTPARSPTRRAILAGTAAAATSSLLLRTSRTARAGDAEITLKLATVAPPGTPWAKHVRRLKKRVKEGTGGKVVIKPYLGGKLGDEAGTASQCRKGGISMWLGTTTAMASIQPELSALDLPYLFPSLRAASGIIDKHIAGDIESMMDKAGFKLLFFGELGFRSIGTNFGAVESTADLKGKKLRVAINDVQTNTGRALASSPQPIPETEAMTALQTGVVDGMLATPLMTFAASYYQAITHFTLTRHSYAAGIAVINKDTWDGLDKDVQELIAGDRDQESAYDRKKFRSLRTQLLDQFDVAGIGLHKSTKSERAAFAKATEPTHTKFTDKYGSTFYNAITKHL